MNKNLFTIAFGIALFALILAIPAPAAISKQGWQVIAVIVLMLTWWLSEAVPIPVTALLPIILFPILGVVPLKAVTANYGHPIVFLFFGGFVIALAMEKWNLHKRIALSIVRRTGTHANGIIFGFMLATAFLSMWISNTATTVMMLPIALSVLSLTHSGNKSLVKQEARFAMSLMIAIAFAANIGGTATLTGTPPNAILAGFIEQTYNFTINYATWMIIGVPFAITLLALAWFIICVVVYPSGLGHIEGVDDAIAHEHSSLGKMSYAEKAVLVVFVSTALLWIFKSFITIVKVEDAMVAVAAAIVLFIIPLKNKDGFLLNWNDMSKLPWGILLLFGGGLSVAGAMRESGLVEVVGSQISLFTDYGTFGMLLLCVFAALLLTECMSNLALISIFLPILAVISVSAGENPLLFTIAATLASSCAFMLPMATPPNAIVFASGHIHISQMVRVGVVMNIIAIMLIMAFAYSVILYGFDIDLATVPEWVNSAK